MVTIAVACALVVPSLIARPGAEFPEVPVAVPPEHGLSVVRAAAAALPRDRQTPSPPRAAAPQREHPRIASARPVRRVAVDAPAPRPVSRPAAAPAAKPKPEAPAPPAAPVPAPAPTPAPQPAPAPVPPEREILVTEPEPVTPPQGKPVVDDPEPPKNEGEKNGHEKNEPQRNGHEHNDDQRGGPKHDRGPRD